MVASSGSTPMAVGDGLGGASTGPDTTTGASTSSSVDVDESLTASTTKMGRRVRATGSDVWQDMEQVNKVVGGKSRCYMQLLQIPPLYSFYMWYWPFASTY
jgi:hypothetical protein